MSLRRLRPPRGSGESQIATGVSRRVSPLAPTLPPAPPPPGDVWGGREEAGVVVVDVFVVVIQPVIVTCNGRPNFAVGRRCVRLFVAVICSSIHLLLLLLLLVALFHFLLLIIVDVQRLPIATVQEDRQIDPLSPFLLSSCKSFHSAKTKLEEIRS